MLLGLLGLRVGEACAANIEDLGMEHGHIVLLVHGKGGKNVLMPLPPAIARAIDLVVGTRCTGPILRTRTGARMDRHAATRIVRRTAKTAGIQRRVHPHVLRHAFVTTMLDAGVPLRDAQTAAPTRRPKTHHPPRPGPTQPRPAPRLHPRRLHGRRLICRRGRPPGMHR